MPAILTLAEAQEVLVALKIEDCLLYPSVIHPYTCLETVHLDVF